MLSNAVCATGLFRRKAMSVRSFEASTKNDLLHESSSSFAVLDLMASRI